MVRIKKDEFKQRIHILQSKMTERNLDAVLVYGDEYRKENLRYVSNFWPIFERGALFIPQEGEPIYAGAPEGENYAREMCIWEDIRSVREFLCVSVPDDIDYPRATFSSLGGIVAETLGGGKNLGVVGMMDMPGAILERIRSSLNGMQILDAGNILSEMRMVKSTSEIACLKEAGRQACEGYRELIEKAIPGNTEREAAAAAEGEARAAGAEAINFTVFCSGSRTATIVGRDTEKVIRDGEMIMAALAVQYEGYVSTAAFPFVAGSASKQQNELLSVLFDAANLQLRYLGDGQDMGEMVGAVQRLFRRHNMGKYDVYPPMHGIGLAEAESPYPDADSALEFRAGMTVNSDISLFGHPAGSNRIEEGFIVTNEGFESITPYIRGLCEEGIHGGHK